MRIFKIPNKCAIKRALLALVAGLFTVASMPLASLGKPAHGIAMYGEPALEAGFDQMPYANPAAPKGGSIRLAEPGGERTQLGRRVALARAQALLRAASARQQHRRPEERLHGAVAV